jgi:hypothetical protein
LIILENEHFKYLQKNQGKRYSLQPTDVVRLNSLHVLRSNRQVYSLTDDFSLAEKLNTDHSQNSPERNAGIKIEKWRWTARDHFSPGTNAT